MDDTKIKKPKKKKKIKRVVGEAGQIDQLFNFSVDFLDPSSIRQPCYFF